jgi:site-specific recombinase XerD
MKKAAAKENPWDGFPLRADDSHTRRELTIEELARLVDMASRESAEFRTLFGIAMYTGMRLGDCCKLTWAEVDIVRSIIQKVPEKTKKYRRGRPVTIPIHKVLADLLMQTPIENRTGYVLPQIGAWAALGAKGMGRIHHRIGKIFHNAGIVTSVKVEGRKWKAPEASFHSLRHTFVSMSANAGVPLHIVQAIVGHESTAMTRHYYHENVAALQQAVEAIPSISETGDISEGKVAQPNASRLAYKGCNAPTSPCVKGRAVLSNNAPQAPQIAYEAEPAIVVSADGVERANPHVEAPATGRFAERSLARREEKLASVEAANSDAQQLGGWGENAPEKAVTPSRDRKERNEWIGRCVRRWCQLKKTSLLEGTSKLVGNGGYRFLQELWERGTAISLEDALDGLDVYLNAKKG